MIRRSRLVLVALLACGGRAQILAANVDAATELRAAASNGSAVTVPAGTDLRAGRLLVGQGSSALGTAAASVLVTPVVVDDYELRVTFAVALQLQATAWFSNLRGDCGSGGVLAPVHDVVVTVTAPRHVRARWEVTWNAPSLLGAVDAFAIGKLDYGNDGSIEFDPLLSTPLLPRTVSFGPGPTALRVVNVASGSLRHERTSAFTFSDVAVRLVPDAGCQATQHAAGCGASALVARENFVLGVDLLASGLQPAGASLAAVAIGLRANHLPLPMPPGCALELDPIAVRWLPVDALGRARHRLQDMPASLRPFAFFAQTLELHGGQLRTGPTVRVDCR